MSDHDLDDARAWDGFYAGDGDDRPHWSGEPNPTLVGEATELPPGRALDVGCGEGADAVWLAGHGWQVTAIDPSNVALGRARAAADAAGVEVAWVRAGLLDLADAEGGFDLVTTHYPVLRRAGADGDATTAALLRRVAPGGTLLFVHHDLDPAHAAERGFDPAEHVTPETLVAALDDGWEVEVLETRPRALGPVEGDDAPYESAHVQPGDVVLRARRRGARGTLPR
jgi:SAM-dependent methyltransferase